MEIALKHPWRDYQR